MKFGLTQSFDCSYLTGQQERLLVAISEDNPKSDYMALIQAGFRRSGEQIYRPHCPQCNACESLRIAVNAFTPNRSHRRLLKRNHRFRCQLSMGYREQYYLLYERYINQRHADGSMFPPSRQQLYSFVLCDWNPPLFIEAWDGDTLIGVAVTDNISNAGFDHAWSAMYTFYDPDYENSALGIWMILQQIQLAAANGLEYLYLGYQIDDCTKMAYKRQFLPHERLRAGTWHRVEKK